jgi:hypothetical protein
MLHPAVTGAILLPDGDGTSAATEVIIGHYPQYLVD